MKLVALVPHPDHVSVRYRVLLFRDALRAAGLELQLEPLERTPLARLRQMSIPRHDQIVLLQRRLLPVWQLVLLRKQTRRLVFDFDDAVYLRDSYHWRRVPSLTRRQRFVAAVRLADLVFAGNTHLAQSAARWTDGEKIQVIPTCVLSDGYPEADHGDRGRLRLVWIGSSSMLRCFGRARDLIETVGRQVPGLVLRVICDRFPQFDNLEIEPIRWSSSEEANSLAQSDVGISWLPDDSWSRGKCGLKVLQYMAAGLPVVASPVGVHRDMVTPEVGFLPTDVDGWIDSLRQLSADAQLRRQLGRRARETLEAGYHPRQWGPVFAAHLRQAALAL